jgi:hypothetical protein
MPAIKTDREISERLLSIDWGQEDSLRQVAAATELPEVRGQSVRLRVDEVFGRINAYRALRELGVAGAGLLGRSLISQANAVFNAACVALEERLGFTRVYVDPPLGSPQATLQDITDLVIAEINAMQNLLDS